MVQISIYLNRLVFVIAYAFGDSYKVSGRLPMIATPELRYLEYLSLVVEVALLVLAGMLSSCCV